MQPPLIEPPEQRRGRIDVPPIELKWHERLSVLNISPIFFVVAVISSASSTSPSVGAPNDVPILSVLSSAARTSGDR